MKFIYLVLAIGLSGPLLAQEICQNGIDDDLDGSIDMADPDCLCYNATAYPASLISNSSFEEMANCPTEIGQFSLLKNWTAATGGSPDYFNCDYGWESATEANLHASDGTGYVGALFTPGWKEYIGTCLQQPLVAGVPYQLVLDVAMLTVDADGKSCGTKQASDFPPVEISIYGNKHCSALQQPGNLGCPTGGDTQTSTQGGDPSWVLVGSVMYAPSDAWDKVIVHFTPSIQVSALLIGPPCTLPSAYSDFTCQPYIVYDDLVLNAYSSFFDQAEAPAVHVTKTGDCEISHYTLEAEKMEGAEPFWISPDQTVSAGSTLSITSKDMAGSYGAYYIMGNCTSAVASVQPFVTYQSEAEAAIRLPNIITPNGDGVNDVMDAEEILYTCQTYELTVLDRWGGLVYKQTNGQAGFSGKNRLGNDVPDGTYFYTLRFGDTDLRGNLAVLR